jgi:hypothetical protein
MSAVPRRTADEVAMALLWAVFGGALIGGAGMTLAVAVGDGGRRVVEEPLSLLVSPLAVGAFSLFVVAPCTLAFGLPSVALIHRLGLARWQALLVCLACATAVQIACVRLLFWEEWHRPADFIWTTPFALGAAVVLWWRMTRPRTFRKQASHP